MGDRRSGQERRLEDHPVEEERREKERREGERSRRQLMDRRVQSTPVENDRRKSVRRSSGAGKEAVPDWMEEVLAEAAKRNEKSPAMSPPPVNKKENDYLEMSYEERMEKAKKYDYMIMAFVLLCLIALAILLVFGV